VENNRRLRSAHRAHTGIFSASVTILAAGSRTRRRLLTGPAEVIKRHSVR
jgi:hypothetical protein